MAQVAIEFLRAVNSAADAFGPLKSAVGGVLYVAETVKKFKSNKKDWAEFADHIQSCLACVLLPENGMDTRDDLQEHVRALESSMKGIVATVETLRAEKRGKRIVTFLKDPEKISGMRQKFDNAIRLFQLRESVTSERNVAEILKKVDPTTVQPMVQSILEKFRDTIVHDIAVADNIRDAFPIAAGASWDPDRACFPGTRVAVLTEIQAWIYSGETEQKIFLVSDMAGSGKSAIAHAVCQRFKKDLVSDFFFTRGVTGRDDYGTLLGHIIRDLAALSKDLGRKIGSILEQDRTLITAGPSRQFDELIVPLHHLFPADRPILIVIDALDEGRKEGDQPEQGLLRILGDEIHRLPGNFRILITCRPDNRIMPFLENKSHVLRLHHALSGDTTQAGDVAIYVNRRLRKMLVSRSLPEDMSQAQALIDKSEGLFIWVATIINFLWTCASPIQQLERLLIEHSPSRRSVESKMDILYQAILDDCNWLDDDFQEGYYLLMGTVIAAKSPLTIAAMQALHKDAMTFENMHQSSLRSLLSGLDAHDKPVQILHLSLREFLTQCTSKHYIIVEKEHNRRLAQLCIDMLISELSDDVSGLNDSTRADIALPDIGNVTDYLIYACSFWTAHVAHLEKEELTETLLKSLLSLKTKLATWMMVVTIKDKFQSLENVRQWAQKIIPNEKNISEMFYGESMASTAYNISMALVTKAQYYDALSAGQEAETIYRMLAADQPAKFSPDLAKSLNLLSHCLSEVGQASESLEVIKEAVDIRRKLAIDQPAKFNPALAQSLINLAKCLSDVGQVLEGLKVNKEAVAVHRMLAADQPIMFNPGLAMSLNNLSNRLSRVGQVREALKTIEEAVNIYRALAVNQPTSFDSDLALSLNNMSNCLSDVGQMPEALKAIEEAITIYRALAVEQSAKFNPDLARSLNNFSNHLSEVGQVSEGLKAIEESINIRRKLAADHPARYNPDLAESLNNLSNRLYQVGQVSEALASIQEAVIIKRTLAADQPARFIPDLAISLNNLSNRLSDVGQMSEALKVIEETITIYRALSVDQPAKFKLHLVAALNNCSVRLSDIGQLTEALNAMQEAVTIRKTLAVDQLARYNLDFADSLNNLSNHLSNSGQVSEALKLMGETVSIQRTLVAAQPAKFKPDLARSLHGLSNHLADAGQVEGSMKAIEEAVALYRPLAADQPEKFQQPLDEALQALSRIKSKNQA
ncbi:TPR-like protein [Artomyces pyxidatus]|uniref:TPR-like protein n=1 Tax=Artomyces pyxidatus TaxID=48021 RepID=A0ACB8SQ26_9AGAM|nr:TPR-like protein [Artomyces pyxidatus]